MLTRSQNSETVDCDQESDCGQERLNVRLKPIFEEPVLKPEPNTSPEKLLLNLEELFIQGYKFNSFLAEVLQVLKEETFQHKSIMLVNCTQRDDRLYYCNQLYVSDFNSLKLQLLQFCHDSLLMRHSEKVKIYEILIWHYYWPWMLDYVAHYTQNCYVCAHIKALRKDYQEVLQSLLIFEQLWKDIFMNFITHLSESNEYDVIIIIVNRLIKMKHMIVCHKICDAEEIDWLFIQHIWSLHSLFTIIVSDWETQFVSEFWKHLTQQLGIQSLLSMAYHSKTDDQTEIINAFLKQYLQAYVSYLQDD